MGRLISTTWPTSSRACSPDVQGMQSQPPPAAFDWRRHPDLGEITLLAAGDLRSRLGGAVVNIFGIIRLFADTFDHGRGPVETPRVFSTSASPSSGMRITPAPDAAALDAYLGDPIQESISGSALSIVSTPRITRDC